MKTTLNKILRWVFTFWLPLLPLSGCEDNLVDVDNRVAVDNLVDADNLAGYFDDYLLHCTFENDAIGSGPNKTLPGLPSGDELKYTANAGILVLYSHGQKSIVLPFTQEPTALPQLPGEIAFASKPATSANASTITVTWSGQLFGYYYNSPWAGGYSQVAISDNAGQVMFYMQICVDGSLLVNKLEPNQINIYGLWSYLFPLGSNLSQHTFAVTFDLNLKQFKLKLDVNGETVLTEYNIPFYETYTPIRNPSFRLNISSYGGEGGYIVDNATIRQTSSISPLNPPF